MKIIALGEVMLRLSQPQDAELNRSNYLNIYIGGGEYNTLVNLSMLAHDVSIITSVPNNHLGQKVITEANTYGVNTQNINFSKGRLGTYYAILGNEASPTSVIYDRMHSCFSESEFESYEFSKIFEEYELFHVSGITAALNEKTQQMTIKAIKLAKKMNLKVSYDSNFRAKLWSAKEAGGFLKEVLPFVDYAFLGILDMKYLLNMEIDDLEKGYEVLKEKYPNIEYFASTNREVISTKKHKLSANVYKNKLYTTKVMDITVKDRIGAGDVFTAGIIDGIVANKKISDIANFALADTVIKHLKYGDNCFTTRQEIENIVSGESMKIKR